jgi:hypothetical protein
MDRFRLTDAMETNKKVREKDAMHLSRYQISRLDAS